MRFHHFLSLFLLLLAETNAENVYLALGRQLYQEFKYVSNKCENDLKRYGEGLMNFEEWAIRMFDSTSKVQPGILRGNLGDLGDFDGCLDISTHLDTGTVNGKYCLGLMSVSAKSGAFNATKIASGINLSWFWSFCIPDSCSGTAGAEYINSLLNGFGIPAQISHLYPERGIECQTQESINKPLDVGAICTLVFFTFILSLITVQTLYDLYVRYNNGEPRHNLDIAFSAYTNGKKLFRMEKSSDGGQMLSCLNGMRFISIMWVVFGHGASSNVATFNLMNSVDGLNWSKQLYSSYVVSAPLAVDTFFVVGGLLVSYGYLRATNSGKKVNILVFYFHRYIRLTPPLLAVVLFVMFLVPFLTSGPDYPTYIASYTNFCLKNWWSTLLYVQNYVNPSSLCVGHSWYLNVDFQLFLLSPILLIPLKKHPRIIILTTVILILCSMGISGYVAYHYKMSGLPTATNGAEYYSQYYLATHTRGSAWLIGFILGYFVHKCKYDTNTNFKPNYKLVFIMWAICILLLLSCMSAGYDTLNGPEYNLEGNVTFITLQKPGWALGICFVIYACTFGFGGPINWFLSWPIFNVLNRLTYSIYLIHVLYMYGKDYSRKSNEYFSDYNMAYRFWGNFMITVIISIGWTLAFESPIIIVEKHLFGKANKNKVHPVQA